MKIVKLYDGKKILIKYYQSDYYITLNELIYKKIAYFICEQEILILLMETPKYICFDMKKKSYFWRNMELELKYANYLDGTIFVVDGNNIFWLYDKNMHFFRRWYNLSYIRFYEISAVTIKENIIYVFDNYSSSCFKINMKYDSFNVWTLKRVYKGIECYINKINKIVIHNGINLYAGDNKVVVIKENNNIIYEDTKGNIFHYPRGIFLYNGILGVCNTYANNILLINEELKCFDANFCIQKPRWIDIDKDYFAICDGNDQKIIFGEISGYTLKKKKEIYGFSDIHCCKIIEDFIYVIDAESNSLSLLNIESWERKDYDLNLRDAHSIKFSADREKLAIADSGNSRIICMEKEFLNKQYIYSVDIEKASREFYMPRALTFLDSNILIYAIGYEGNLVFYDINKRNMIRCIKIKEIGSFIDKARDLLVAEDQKSIFFSLTEQSAVIRIKFSQRISERSIEDIRYTEIVFCN